METLIYIAQICTIAYFWGGKNESMMLLMLHLIFIDTVLLAFQMKTAPVFVVGKILTSYCEHTVWHFQCKG